MLPDAGMIIVAIAEIAVLRREVKAVDLLITSLICLCRYLVERLLDNLQFLAAQHRTAKEDNHCLGIMITYQFQ